MKGGYVAVDLHNVVIDKALDGKLNKINGIYAKMKDAIATGKPVMLYNIGDLKNVGYKVNMNKTLFPILTVEPTKITFLGCRGLSSATAQTASSIQISIDNTDIISWS